MSSGTRVPRRGLVRVVERARHYVGRLHQRLAPTPVVMQELIVAAWMSQAIAAAADLGVADALAKEPLGLNELADRVGAHPDALKRLLRALIGRGILRQRRDGRYELNPLGHTLRSDAPGSMTGMARLVGAPQWREHWSQLVEAVRTGEAVLPKLRGKDPFEYLRGEPELAEIFNHAMTNISELAVAPVIAAYDFGPYPTIVDVGGGHGRLLAAILTTTPGAHAVLYDLSQVVASAATLLREHNVADRVRIASGSFFDGVPPGGDAYVLKNVIHDWPDDKAVHILRRVRAAAHPAAVVLLIEFVLPNHHREFLGNVVDLEMLVQATGRERTAHEYRHLLAQAGFEMTRVVPTAGPFSLVEAKPAPAPQG
jgi:O-methyltransferase domain/Dimerisation domain